MRVFILVVNYAILVVVALGLLSLFEIFDMEVVLGSILLSGIVIPNIVYAHITKPIDIEKEDLKEQIKKLKNDNKVSKN